jgi:hypothetical protein
MSKFIEIHYRKVLKTSIYEITDIMPVYFKGKIEHYSFKISYGNKNAELTSIDEKELKADRNRIVEELEKN